MKPGSCITLVGTGMDSRDACLSTHPALKDADIVIAGQDILDALGDIPARTMAVKAPVTLLLDEAAALFAQGNRIVVMASGDPLFYSIGTSFAERFGPENLRILPGITSLQQAAARMGIPWGDVITVSAHGRQGLLPLAHAVMEGGPVCLLTDGKNSPDIAARFLLDRGRTGYSVHVAANIGRENESLWSGYLAEAAKKTFDDPNVAFFLPDPSLPSLLPLCPGQPETAFASDGACITKWPVRAAALAALRIESRHVVWDLGSGSGSVAIEAASLARRGHVVAVEKEARRIRNIEENRRRFGAANLDILHAAMPECLRETCPVPDDSMLAGAILPRPDRVFIGGGLGMNEEQARQIIRAAWERLLPGGRMVASCVLLENVALAQQEMALSGGHADVTLIQAGCASPLGSGTRLQGLNPVFLLAVQKKS